MTIILNLKSCSPITLNGRSFLTIYTNININQVNYIVSWIYDPVHENCEIYEDQDLIMINQWAEVLSKVDKLSKNDEKFHYKFCNFCNDSVKLISTYILYANSNSYSNFELI